MAYSSILANKERVAEAIEKSSSVKECLKRLGLRAAGGNYKQFYFWCERHGLTPPKSNKHNELLSYYRENSIPLEDVLIENSSYSRGSLKKRLIREGLLEEVCEACGIAPRWNSKKLTLQLDHRNGVYNDNRIENLRLLCPNCHSQTRSFAGRRTNYGNKKPSCSKCQRSISKFSLSGLCRKCATTRSNFSKRKVQRPTREELHAMIWEKPTTQVAKDFGVSDKAIEKWCKAYGISKPPRGYWAKPENQ